MRVSGKVAIVTGGAGGIGAGCAQLLASEGAKVVVTDIVGDGAKRIAKEFGGEHFQHDVANFDEWCTIATEVWNRHGKIDILINCAGIEGSLDKGGLDTPLESWSEVLDINLSGTFFGCKAVMPYMLRQGTGSIILISSMVSFMASTSGIAYGAAKAGVQQLSRSIAILGARDGNRVRCNSVHPGIIRTGMTKKIVEKLSTATGKSKDEVDKMLVSVVPFQKWGQPEDIANMCLFLASDEASYVTGAEFKVDGGWGVINSG